MKDIISDDDLILYLMAELPEQESQAIQKLLPGNEALQHRLDELRTTLALSESWQTEPDNGFEQRLWNQIEAGLPAEKTVTKKSVFDWLNTFVRQPAFAFALVVVAVVSAFMGGRIMQHQEMLENPEAMIASLDDEARQNILMQSVSMHFERTSRLMTTVAVSDQLSLNETEQAWASQLLTSNRIFKTAAQNANQWRIVSLLEEIEPILIEMAHADELGLSSRQNLKQRIDDNGLVFKTRMYSESNRPTI